MTAHLYSGAQPVHDPHAVLSSPGLSVVYLTERGASGSTWLAFTDPGEARELARACTRAAELLESPRQIVGET